MFFFTLNVRIMACFPANLTFYLFYCYLCYLIQNGVTSSIKPQQITFIVPGVENFDHAEISAFIQKAQENLVCSYPVSYRCGYLLPSGGLCVC